MHHIDLKNVDLNLLVALDVLLEEGSVGRAAGRLGRSQSATSHTLARLRDLLGDPLLVRDGHQMCPTPRAEALREPLGAALREVRRTLARPEDFDPATAERTFPIAGHDLLVPWLAQAFPTLRAQAPGVRLRLLPPATGTVLAESPTLALGTFGAAESLPVALETARLLESPWATFVRARHAVAAAPDLTTWCELSHVRVATPNDHTSPVQRALDAVGAHRAFALDAPSFLAALHAVAVSDLAFTGPLAPLAGAAAALGLRQIAVPLVLDPLQGRLAWHRRFTEDPGHRWLREQLLALAHRSSAEVGRHLPDPAAR
ncbi:MAG: LysR family transcriptional regulator [Myxococcales bacterium]|nr:LysR family transcriptional regulator [Myxococcales bacterium]